MAALPIDTADLYALREALDPDWWAERHFVIPETKRPIRLAPHQRAVLRFAFHRRKLTDPFPYTTVIWSTVKKSGKTAIAGLVGRWAAETWGPMGEIYCLANDYEQARGRIFEAAARSIELDADYDWRNRVVPGRWLVRDRELTCLTTGSVVKALAGDYKGEAGSNPTLSLWSELWGYELERARRLWEEMTPSPTRPISMRWVETYAGFEGESELLYELYDLAVKQGRPVTVGELSDAAGYDCAGVFAEATRPSDPVPIYVNDRARLCAYWDVGEAARRMPWQQGEQGRAYYAEQAQTLRPGAFRRFHLNEWASAEGAFVEEAAWDACQTVLPPLDARTPLVIAVDASVSGDCTALVAVSRHPDRARHKDEVLVRRVQVWVPAEAASGTMDYDRTLTPAVEALAKGHKIVMVAYDPYQLHHWAGQLRKRLRLRFFEFGQGERRLVADKTLADLIEQRRLGHDGNPTLKAHVMAAAAKDDPEGHKLRIVKKSASRPIDAAVALSMAAYECLRLNL